LLRICFRLARDVGCTVAELNERVSWPEFLNWMAFYLWEADEQLPPGKRPVRARTPEQGVAALNRAFKIRKT
jgi:hypothetical protein